MLWSGLPTPEMYKRTKLLPVYVLYGALVRRSESEPTFQRNLRIPSKFEGLIKMAKKKEGWKLESMWKWIDLGRRRVGWGDLSWIKNLSYGDRRRAPAFGPTGGAIA